jgi:hypothetical protein
VQKQPENPAKDGREDVTLVEIMKILDVFRCVILALASPKDSNRPSCSCPLIFSLAQLPKPPSTPSQNADSDTRLS